MIGALTRFLPKSASDRRNASYQSRVQAINALEAELAALSDLELGTRTAMFRYDVTHGGRSLDDVLVAAFATVREAAKRTLGLRHFDGQLLGGMALHDGHIAEIATGEGKTLIATLPAYLNALAGRGVHVITVNDYLSRRDAEWMGQIYEFLGLSIGAIKHGLDDTARRAAYACDITYGTSAEFGFDYLRDNMKYRQADMVQRGHFHAILDEADSILIDEARTPLVISGSSDQGSDLYITIDAVISELASGDYEVDEKLRSVPLTRSGIDKVEHRLSAANLMKTGSLFNIENISLLHHVNQALIAHKLFRRDRDYIVHNGEAIIVDEVTGRMLLGRRHAGGLHQAIEAREHLEIRPENRTLASVTIQNYFRMYEKLSGMTGTALTEAAELSGTYRTEVMAVPPHKPSLREDRDDEIYRTEAEKLRAVCATIEECRQRGQPILVGTTSIEKSERLAELLCEQGWKRRDVERLAMNTGNGRDSEEVAPQKLFALLNARHHEQEAHIVARAGIPGAVTIATNMAGRGVDIQLGGNVEMRLQQELAGFVGDAREKRADEIRRQATTSKQQAIAAGGLFVLGTERHESRRIDNQLRGRAGRQGDPGCSKFLISLEDDLLRGPGPRRFDRLRKSAATYDGRLVAHSLISKAVKRAQQRIEARNLGNRQNMLRFDDVLNDQRKIVFDQRLALMEDDRISDAVTDMRHGFVDDLVRQYLSAGGRPPSWDWDILDLEVRSVLTLDVPVSSWKQESDIQAAYVRDYIADVADSWMAGKVDRWGDSRMRVALRRVVIALLDDLWLRHVSDLEMLRRAAPLRAHGRRDPLVEFKIEAFELFEQMLCRLRRNVTAATMRVGFEDDVPTQPIETEEEHDVFVPDHLVNALH